MLVNSFGCPHCGRRLKVAAGVKEGLTVKCPRCGKEFAARADQEGEDSAPEEGTRTPIVQSSKRASIKWALPHDDEAEERRKSMAGRRPAATKAMPPDDEDEEPRPKKMPSRVLDDDDYEEPRPEKKKNKVKKAKFAFGLVHGIALVVAVIALVGTGLVIYQKRFVQKTVDEDNDFDPRSVQRFSHRNLQPTPPIPKQPVVAAIPNVPDAVPGRHQGEGRVYDQKQGFSIIPPKDWVPPRVRDDRSPSFINFLSPKRTENFAANLNVLSIPSNDTIEKVAEKEKLEAAKVGPSYIFGGDGMTTIDGQKTYFIDYSGTARIPGNDGPSKLKILQYFLLSKDGKKEFVLTFTTFSTDFEKLRKTFEEAANSVRVD